MRSTRPLTLAFWTVLVAFLAWDHFSAPRIDLRFEPPLIAAGSGQPSAGGHCALPR